MRFGLQKEQAPLPSTRDRTTIRHAGIFLEAATMADLFLQGIDPDAVSYTHLTLPTKA